MFNAMKYIRSLEAVGFERNQAEAQVQFVLDAMESELATKSDFLVFKEETKRDFLVFKEEINKKFIEFEFRIITRLGFVMVSCTTIAVALMTWLIKLH